MILIVLDCIKFKLFVMLLCHMRSSFSMSLLYHAYVYLEFLILACTIYILAPLALVRYQKRELPKAAGAEYDVINSSDMLQAEKNRHGELGKYVDCITHTLSLQNKKKAYFNSHIWGL